MYHKVGHYTGPLQPLVAIIPYPSDASGMGYRTVHGQEALYASYLRDTFPGTWARGFFSIIWKDGSIVPHLDSDMRADATRFHLVIQTNPDCWMLHDGQWQQLEAGGIYTLDPLIPHASVNWGHSTRVHLVVDVLHE